MKNNRFTIVDRLMTVVWLFESVFGRYTDLIIYDQEKEKAKRFLREIYGKTDVDDLFPPELDTEQFNNTMKILFQYMGDMEANNNNKK